MKELIPWATTAGTLVAMYVIGRKKWWGWLVGLANQALWITFAVMFRAWGLLPLSLALTVLYTKNLFGWRADDAVEVTP